MICFNLTEWFRLDEMFTMKFISTTALVDIAIAAAAVADYRPKNGAVQK